MRRVNTRKEEDMLTKHALEKKRLPKIPALSNNTLSIFTTHYLNFLNSLNIKFLF